MVSEEDIPEFLLISFINVFNVCLTVGIQDQYN